MGFVLPELMSSTTCRILFIDAVKYVFLPYDKIEPSALSLSDQK
jgi:hypothetical protein